MSRVSSDGDDRLPPGSAAWCTDGTHDITPSRRHDHDRCVVCGKSKQAIYDAPRGAQVGDFRVVCRESECSYGDRVDLEGNGYTNHVSILLARAALRDHQAEVSGGDPERHHAALIQQHPVSSVAPGADP